MGTNAESLEQLADTVYRLYEFYAQGPPSLRPGGARQIYHYVTSRDRSVDEFGEKAVDFIFTCAKNRNIRGISLWSPGMSVSERDMLQ